MRSSLRDSWRKAEEDEAKCKQLGQKACLQWKKETRKLKDKAFEKGMLAALLLSCSLMTSK